jgi:hypothetical protein
MPATSTDDRPSRLAACTPQEKRLVCNVGGRLSEPPPAGTQLDATWTALRLFRMMSGQSALFLLPGSCRFQAPEASVSSLR